MLTVNETVRHLRHEFSQFVMWCKDLCQIYQFQTTLQATLQGNGDSTSIIIILLECNFSNKAEIIELKEILQSQTYDPKLCMHLLTPKRDGLIDKPHT